ncbi:hypothetical protein C8A05DRAFT_47042 [Staphylotrichum tortipilum]|uniref:Uncharacterized protein n=1 Tax=Staphylotrichum tortipilum TaxID=2831512 RepID=A0AAN6MDX9_9PEZI|nr:hypothetical protein C8A05DRAFT_47042 [Staphylotrichum longicolle]
MAETKTTTVLNGDSPHSTTLRHLLTLPAIQDGVRAFQANPLGKMSIQLSASAYNLVAAAPMLSLITKPYAYVSPYVQRVDEFGDQALSKVEAKYPVVKKPSPELLKEAREAVYAPVRHVTDVYNGAYQSTGVGAVATGKAAAKTVVVVGVEGAIFALREALRFTESLQINKSLKAAVDQLEAALNKGRDGAGPTEKTPAA